MVKMKVFLLDCLFEVKNLKIYLQILSSAIRTWKRTILPQEVFFIFFEFSRISYLLYQISHVLRLGKYFDGNFGKEEWIKKYLFEVFKKARRSRLLSFKMLFLPK